jgi:C-terminal processing protease CtpA/Prc
MKKVYVAVIITLCISQVNGQRRMRQGTPSKPQAIALSQVHNMVKNLADSIAVNYIDPKKAPLLKSKLLSELKNGSFDKFSEKKTLASHLSKILTAWSNDKHFNILLAGQRKMMPRSYDHFSKQNYFFEKMEHLDGNISYIKFNRFIPPSNAGSLVVSAMLFAANSNAVIIDLRDNVGGSPQVVSMLAGFFMKKPTLININYTRGTNVKQETWSAKTDVIINSTNQEISSSDLERLKELPVYILTSDYTFSAAEMFSSSLQGHKRAIVVGEKTGGGGHGIRPFKISEGFTAFIPFNSHYHPVTEKTWEVVGIQPDIACSADDALRIAQINILKEFQKKPNHDSKISEYLKKLEIKNDK